MVFNIIQDSKKRTMTQFQQDKAKVIEMLNGKEKALEKFYDNLLDRMKTSAKDPKSEFNHLIEQVKGAQNINTLKTATMKLLSMLPSSNKDTTVTGEDIIENITLTNESVSNSIFSNI